MREKYFSRTVSHMAFTVRAMIKPRSSQGPKVVEAEDTSLTIFVREPALEGKANLAACRILAQHFNTSPSKVVLSKGHTSRYKTFTIND